MKKKFNENIRKQIHEIIFKFLRLLYEKNAVNTCILKIITIKRETTTKMPQQFYSSLKKKTHYRKMGTVMYNSKNIS